MLYKNVMNAFASCKEGKVLVDCDRKYLVNDMFIEKGNIYFRSFQRMDDEELEICDISYSEKNDEKTGEDFLKVIKNNVECSRLKEYADNIECLFSLSLSESCDFNIEIVDNTIIFKLLEE